jgi:hypothetical protein
VSVRGLARRLGVNYAWGLVNFTAGVAGGGVFVAAALITAGLVGRLMQ